MFALILAELVAAAGVSPVMMLQAQAAVAAEAPKTRKVCHDVPQANSRFTKRVCSTVVERQPTVARAAAPAPVVVTTLGVGMAVVDTQGAAVGTITAVAADSVTVKTARHQAQLPKASLTVSDGKALFGMSQAELDASIERSLAAAGPKVGATVKGRDGSSVGTIDLVGADTVTIRLADGVKINIPRSGIAIDATGGGVIGLTAAELEAQVKAAQPAR